MISARKWNEALLVYTAGGGKYPAEVYKMLPEEFVNKYYIRGKQIGLAMLAFWRLKRDQLPSDVSEKPTIRDVVTVVEAERGWNVGRRQIMRYCYDKGVRNGFTPAECRKSGGVWLISVNAMDRRFQRRAENECE